MINHKIVREKIAELALLDGCELTKAELDRLEGVWTLAYTTPMPGWAYEMLQSQTLDQRVYKLGQMTRRVQLQNTLCIGRSKIVKK